MPYLRAILPLCLLSLASTGCSGLLLLPTDFADGTDDGGADGGGGECTPLDACEPGEKCEAGKCVDDEPEPETCRSSTPQGECPADRDCSGGVCVESGESWCDCLLGEVCLDGDCITPVPGLACSNTQTDGFCAEGSLCVVGTCIPIIPANECMPERSNGLCPSGSVCVAGYCIPVDDDQVEECSATNRDGICPPGQYCDNGTCRDAPCSSMHPYGICLIPDTMCVGGFCEPVGSLVTCVDLDCPGLNREACDDESEPPACGDCLTGYHESLTDQCLPDTCTTLTCAMLHRNCDTSGPYAFCTDCVTNYHADTDDDCVADTCAQLTCVDQHRICDDSGWPPVCSDCVTGYHVSLELCEPDTCIHAGCDPVHRICTFNGEYWSCGDCDAALSYVDNGAGECVRCLSSAECEDDHYCSETEGCTQDCDPEGDGSECAGYEICAPDGRCVPTTTGGSYCAAAVAEGDLIEPTVSLLIDRSGSMNWGFPVDGAGNPSRWSVLRTALFGDGGSNEGVVFGLQSKIRFGMTFYTSGGTCPLLDELAPGIDNYGAMVLAYDDTGPASGTPTGESITSVSDALVAIGDNSPKYILLATDGEPYYCDGLSSSAAHLAEGRRLAIERAGFSFAAGVPVFIISVGADIADEHLQDVANAGAGVDPTDCDPATGDGCATFYKATDPQALQDDLSEILGNVLSSCIIQMNVLDDQAIPVTGDLYIDGQKLIRDDPDGWLVLSNTKVELKGAACDQALSDGEHFIWVAFTYCYDGG